MVGHFPNTVFLYSNWKYNNFKQLLRKEILEINVYRFVWKRGAVMEMKTVVVVFLPGYSDTSNTKKIKTEELPKSRK